MVMGFFISKQLRISIQKLLFDEYTHNVLKCTLRSQTLKTELCKESVK